METGPVRLYLPLGFGSLYNHSEKPNLRYSIERTIDGEHVVMVMKATEDVAAGKIRSIGEL